MSDVDGGGMANYSPKTHVAGVCEVVGTGKLTPQMQRITLHGDCLTGLDGHWHGEMLIRLYFPPKGKSVPPEPYLTSQGELEFKTEDGVEVSPFSAFSEDPLVRAYTARAYRSAARELDVDFVIHDVPGLASDWARTAKPGDRIGIVEFQLPPSHLPASARQADTYVMFADEAALPAAQTNFEGFAPGANVIAFLEVEDENEEQHIETKANLKVTWLHRGNALPGTSGLLLKAVKEMAWPSGKVFCWVCGEIKTVTEIRRVIKNERGLKKGEYKTQAYWRRGKTEVERMARMTEVVMADAEADPANASEFFEDVGMNVEDPSLFESTN